jgi:hypothetical protein
LVDSNEAHTWGENLTTQNCNSLVIVARIERLKMFRGDRVLSRRGSESVDKRRGLCFSCKFNIRVLLSGSNKMQLCWISREVGGSTKAKGHSVHRIDSRIKGLCEM